jgi:hypothetical protein
LRSLCEFLQHNLIEHTHTTQGDGSHRQFFSSWYTQLANDGDIQWSMQGSSDFKRHEYSTSRQRQHQDIWTIGIG